MKFNLLTSAELKLEKEPELDVHLFFRPDPSNAGSLELAVTVGKETTYIAQVYLEAGRFTIVPHDVGDIERRLNQALKP